MQNKLKMVDLFSGIGGFRLVFEKLNAECIAFSEINQNAIKFYKDNYKKIKYLFKLNVYYFLLLF